MAVFKNLMIREKLFKMLVLLYIWIKKLILC